MVNVLDFFIVRRMSFEWGFPNKIKFQKKKFQIEETSVEHKVEKNYIVIFIF